MSSNQVSYIQQEQVRVPAATNKLNLYTPAALKALKALKIYLLGVRLFCPFSIALESGERKFSTGQIKIYLIEAAAGWRAQKMFSLKARDLWRVCRIILLPIPAAFVHRFGINKCACQVKRLLE